MEDVYETEWQWFRRSFRDSILRPRRFAASLAQDHYGLAGVLVAIIAGAALSVSVDALVIASKGLDPVDFASRMLTDAALLGARLAIVAALVASVVAGSMRLVRHVHLSLDQAYTAVTFALTPLIVAPFLAAALALIPPLLPVISVLVLALLGRLLYGLLQNLRPLAPLPLAVVSVAIVIACVPITLSDQVDRIKFTALAYQPSLAPELRATPPAGQLITGEGYTITIPPRWKQVTLGLPGEIGRFETQNDVLIIMRANGSALVTPDTYAASVAVRWRRGLDESRSSRAIIRSGGLVMLDDTYVGTVDGRPELLRQLTAVVGTQGMALQFRYIDPDETQALTESAAIAAGWHVLGR